MYIYIYVCVCVYVCVYVYIYMCVCVCVCVCVFDIRDCALVDCLEYVFLIMSFLNREILLSTCLRCIKSPSPL